MLIEFSVGNYRSFKDVVTFSMVAAPIEHENEEIDRNNIFAATKEIDLLKSAAIYGANASGKSNLVRAISFMRDFVINSAVGRRVKDPIDTEVYRLSKDVEGEPSYFNVVFMIGNTRYRYGFEVDRQSVKSEWLYQTLRTKESEVFSRQNDKIKVSSKFDEGKLFVKNTRANALFLSVVAQFNGEISKNIMGWFENTNKIADWGDEQSYAMMTVNALRDNEQITDMIALVKSLDLGIQDIKILETPVPEFQGVTKIEIKTAHWKYDSLENKIATEEFDLENDESAGTKKLFYISKLLIDILDNGERLIIDELDARLHPLITCAIVKLFNSSKTNPNNAQLIFTTHDTNLLSCNLFRKDQVWFTEKNRYGATDLYSLVEYKVPDNSSFEQDYITGRYGAVPFIGDLSRLLGKYSTFLNHEVQ